MMVISEKIIHEHSYLSLVQDFKAELIHKNVLRL